MEGNQMKMREALLVVSDALDTISAHEDDIEFVRTWIGQTKIAVQEALSAPARQCDVGTAAEQVRRYKLFCENHSGWDGQKRFGCLNCPLIDVDECEFMWAQMPYEHKTEGAG